MRSNGELDTGTFEIPAKVYPGMFEREYQVTIQILGREITVIVSSDDIELKAKPVEQGVEGKLKVALVAADEASVLIDLPGEPLGTSRRFKVPRTEMGRWSLAGA